MFPIATTNQSQTTRIVIREVNMSTSFVAGTDAFGKTYKPMLDFFGPIIMVPAVNEMWLIKRRGNDWILDQRLESGSETTTITDLNPGDRRIEAQGSLFLNGENVVINGKTFTAIAPGSIILTKNSVAPAGWALCDGTNGTPNLTGLAPGSTHYIIKL